MYSKYRYYGYAENPASSQIASLALVTGNIFAIRPGKEDGPPTYAGSHLDTQVRTKRTPFKRELLTLYIQPTGGRYDGIVGVHAGIEALKTMNDHGIGTKYPTGIFIPSPMSPG
jgi:hypothetical protein